MSFFKKSPREHFDSAENSSLKKEVTWPSFSQWIRLPSVLSRPERIILLVLVVLFLGSTFFLTSGFYVGNTEITPTAGGKIVEGIVGSPCLINPVYAVGNDADRDLVELIFSGILKYNSDGELEPDLAKTFPEEESDGTSFVVDLREDVLWHDGEQFDADDIIFTIQTIQDPAYKSPLRANWIGVEIEKISNFRLRFQLQEPYAPFLERLTQKIIPAHIWKLVSAENSALCAYNLQPVGTGPYEIASIGQERSSVVQSITLEKYEKYHGSLSFIESFVFRFFESQEAVAAAAQEGTLDSFVVALPRDAEPFEGTSFAAYSFSLPRYFAVFFNIDTSQKDSVVDDRSIREALAAIIDKEALVSELFEDQGRIVSSPLLSSLFGFQEPVEAQSRDHELATTLLENEGYLKEDGKLVKIPKLITGEFSQRLKKESQGTEVRNLQECLASDPEVYPEGQVSGLFGPLTEKAVIRFQEKYASDILTPLGLTKGTGTVGPSTREKLNEICFEPSDERIPLKIVLSTVDQSPLKETANILQAQWEAFGIDVEVKIYSAADLERDVLKPRNYEALLFGEILGKIPDPFPYWHSSQVKDPGLNLSSYENSNADKLLERARKQTDEAERIALYEELQDVILADDPAIFLYDIDYIYLISEDIQGVKEQVLADPSKRFSGSTDWYIDTQRIWK